MPIIRSGYATRKRNGSTRAYRQARAQTLSEETTCWLCGQPATPDNTLEADHIIPWAAHGPDTRANLKAAHRTCNNRRGADEVTGG